jgi:hypothetical protein
VVGALIMYDLTGELQEAAVRFCLTRAARCAVPLQAIGTTEGCCALVLARSTMSSVSSW